jgi:hypothetical protein
MIRRKLRPTGIHHVEKWPPNSSGFNMVELAWWYLKKKIPRRRFRGMKTCKEVAEAVGRALVDEWERMPQKLINRYCDNFHPTLRRMVDHGGSNNYKPV